MDMSLDTKALGQLFELSRDAVVGIADGTVLFANPAAEDLFGLHAGDAAADAIPAEILDEPSDRFSASCVIRGVPMDMTVVRQEEFSLLRAAKRAAQNLQPSAERALSELGVDLATARHAADAILAEDADPAQRREKGAMLYRSLYRLRRLHRHLLLAESITQNRLSCSPRPSNLRRICADVCDSVAQLLKPGGYTIRFEAPKNACYCRVDADLIETMLLNLLTNSLLYSGTEREIAVTLSVTAKSCVIAVNDRGCGMDPEKLTSALGGTIEALYTETKAGSGLGLFIARGIVEAHGGTMILESREDVGTSVRISLPRLRDERLELMSTREPYLHIDGMAPILTELSVFLDRSYYEEHFFD